MKPTNARINQIKHVFEKGYTPNQITKLYKIPNAKITYPEIYVLEEMHGKTFYKEELEKIVNPDGKSAAKKKSETQYTISQTSRLLNSCR